MFRMTPQVLQNFFTRRATRRYPYVVRPPFEGTRGELCNEIEKCTFCALCAVKCPSQCITVDKATATWSCDPFACVYCGICVDACTSRCLHQKPDYRPAAREHVTISLRGEIKKKAKKEIQGASPSDASSQPKPKPDHDAAAG